jgi:hypothetical protein
VTLWYPRSNINTKDLKIHTGSYLRGLPIEEEKHRDNKGIAGSRFKNQTLVKDLEKDLSLSCSKAQNTGILCCKNR